ncbi:hypothetical protein [Streptomyces sp. NPDC060333]|uniref:hypothetical protein n=1 Tax=Streptomyces sp. NPDC060333 TaxID=3347098 RepID=UPI00365137EA
MRLGRGPERLQDEFHPGEEEDYDLLLEIHGVFDVPKQLDERKPVIAEHLRTAWAATGGLRSGHAINLSRLFVTGELSLASRTLAPLGPRHGPGRPTELWTAMAAASELLDPTDRNEVVDLVDSTDRRSLDTGSELRRFIDYMPSTGACRSCVSSPNNKIDYDAEP